MWFLKTLTSWCCIVQCIEIKVDKLSVAIQENICMSRVHKVKCLVGITLNVTICFLSKCYKDKTSDEFIIDDGGFILRLELGDQVLAGKGIPGFKIDCINNNSVRLYPQS